MFIISTLICENFSRVAVKISWGYEHGVYAAVLFSANVTSSCSRYDTHIFTSIILYMNIIFIAQRLFDSNCEILHCSNGFARRQKLCKSESTFK